GFAGLAADAGYAFELRRQMQTAADSAVMAGALALSNDAAADFATAARIDSAKNRFTNGVNATVAVNKPPLTGPFTDPVTYPGYIEVIVSQEHSTFFMTVFG